MNLENSPRYYKFADWCVAVDSTLPCFAYEKDLCEFQIYSPQKIDSLVKVSLFEDTFGVNNFYCGPAEIRRTYLEDLAPKIGIAKDFVANCQFSKSSAYVFWADRCLLEVLAPVNNKEKLRLSAIIIDNLNNFSSIQDGLFLHAAGAIIDGKAFAIPGIPGAGKSTAMGMIEYDFLLSDDMVVLRFEDEHVRLYSTPLGPNTDGQGSAPIKAVFFPIKSDHFEMRKISKLKAIENYYHAQVGYWDKVFKPYRKMHFEKVCQLFSRVKAYEMHFTVDNIDNNIMRRIMSEA